MDKTKKVMFCHECMEWTTFNRMWVSDLGHWVWVCSVCSCQNDELLEYFRIGGCE